MYFLPRYEVTKRLCLQNADSERKLAGFGGSKESFVEIYNVQKWKMGKCFKHRTHRKKI